MVDEGFVEGVIGPYYPKWSGLNKGKPIIPCKCSRS